MRQIKSELVLASKNGYTDDILFTFRWTFPRIILAEINTHRMFSRNTASSRAIPSKKQRANIYNDPFIPRSIGLNRAGMQSGEEMSGWRRSACLALWKAARMPNLAAAWAMEKLGAHKQVVNRLLEPWMWCEQVVSATDWENFIGLRDHWMAEPHFQELARQAHMQIEKVRKLFTLPQEQWVGFYFDDKPVDTVMQVLGAGEWHLPFVDKEDRRQGMKTGNPSEIYWQRLKLISSARCARVSYYLPESGARSDFAKDAALHNRLVVRNTEENDPIHASPVEHQATPMIASVYVGNFRGWKQYRKEFKNESGENNAQTESKENQSASTATASGPPQ